MNQCTNRPRLDAYHDGQLSPTQQANVEAHVRGCPACAAELRALRGMSGFFGANPLDDVSDEHLLQLAGRIRAERINPMAILRLFRIAATAAVVLLAGTIAAGLYLQSRTRSAAHDALVLDRAATMIESPGAPPGMTDDQQARLAQWVVDDLAADRQEAR